MHPQSLIGATSSNAVYDRRRTSRFSVLLTRFYVAAQAVLGLVAAAASAAQHDALTFSRGALQLASVLALAPVAAVSPTPPPTVPAFTAAVAMLVDALLRALASVHQIVHAANVSHAHGTYVIVAAVEVVVAVGALVAAAPYAVQNLIFRRAFLSGDSSTSSRIGKDRRREMSSKSTDLCALMLFLHAATSVAARVGDIAEGYAIPSAKWPALLHGVASVLTILVLFAPAKEIAFVLLHAAPEELAVSLGTRMESLTAFDGVFAVQNVHFWEETLGICVGNLSITIAPGTKASIVRRAVAEIFGDVVDHLTVQVEEMLPADRTDPVQHHGSLVISSVSRSELALHDDLTDRRHIS